MFFRCPSASLRAYFPIFVPFKERVMFDICCIGHITLDRVITPSSEKFMAGGTSFYFSNAIRQMEVKYKLITALAETEKRFADKMIADGIDVAVYPSKHTVFFENIYSYNLDHRTQRVRQTADSFNTSQLRVDAAYYHLGPLLADDMPLDVIEYLATKGKVSLDVQGFLRTVRDEEVLAIDWKEKLQALPYIHTLKVNEQEMEVLTGTADVEKAALMLSDWGVKEVVMTFGSMGSVIYANNNFYQIPAYPPSATIDATGCGDTYMAGYLYRRVKGDSPKAAGKFAAAMASIKIANSGPFAGTEADVQELLLNAVEV